MGLLVIPLIPKYDVIVPRANMSNVTGDAETLLQYKAGDILWIYVSPILLFVGTIGSVLSAMVLLRKPMRKSTTMFYLTCLSFGDLFTLYTGLLRYWIRSSFDVDVRNLSDMGCKIHTFLVYLSLDFTVWVLVSVTIDRCLSVSLPFKARRICTLFRSKIVVLVILVTLILKNMHFLWNLKVSELWEVRCDGKSDGVRDFLHYVWPWIDFSTFCLVPFTIMIVCNIKIIYHIVVSQKRLQAHQGLYDAKTPSTTSPETPSLASPKAPTPSNVDISEMTERTVRFKRDKTTHGSTAVPQSHKQKRAKSLPAVTATLLTVNCVFLVTTTPVQVFLIGEQYWYPDKTPEEIAWHNFWWAVVNILQYSNNCVHFFLYCLTGPRFRYELKCMFKRGHRVSMVGDFVSGTEH